MKHKMARQVRDPLTTQFLNAMLETPLPKIAEEIEDELCNLVSGYASDQELANGCIDRSDQDAAELLETLITDWTEILRQEPVWSSAKGLYVQRRLPIDLFGLLFLPGEENRVQRQSMNVGTERILVNSLGAGKLDDDLIVDQAATFPVSSEDIAPLFKHVLRAQHLWILQNTARIVGKGCGVSFDLGDLPKTTESDVLRAAMDVYDARHQNGGLSDVGIAGTNVLVLAEKQTPTTIAACHYLGEQDELRLVAPELAAEFMAVKDEIAPIQYQPMFQFDHFDLKPLSKIFVSVSHSGDWHDKNLPAILALLHALGRSKSVIYDYQIRRFGYIRVSREELFRLLADFNDSLLVLLRGVLPGTSNVSLTPADLFRALLKVDGKLWPVTDGPVVRQSEVL